MADGSFVAETMELGEDRVEVDDAFSDKNFFAEFVGVGGPEAVFGVDVADVRTEDIDRVDRIGLCRRGSGWRCRGRRPGWACSRRGWRATW